LIFTLIFVLLKTFKKLHMTDKQKVLQSLREIADKYLEAHYADLEYCTRMGMPIETRWWFGYKRTLMRMAGVV